MSGWKRTALGTVAVVLGLFVSVVLITASASGVDYTEMFSRPLIRYILTLADNASIRPASDGGGAVGTSSYRIGTAAIRNATIDTSTSAQRILGSTVGGPNGSVLMWVHNISAASLAAGDALVWDNAATTVVNAQAYGLTAATIASDLSTETANGGWFSLRIAVAGTAVGTDTVRVIGKDEDGVRQDFKCPLVAGATSDTWVIDGSTRLYWTDIDTVQTLLCDAAITTATITAYGYATVKASDGANTDFAGVATETIADNDIGRIAVHGPVDCTVDAGTADATPGVMLELAANGDMVVDASATTAQDVARVLEYSNLDDTKIRVFIDSY